MIGLFTVIYVWGNVSVVLKNISKIKQERGGRVEKELLQTESWSIGGVKRDQDLSWYLNRGCVGPGGVCLKHCQEILLWEKRTRELSKRL